MKKHVFIVSIFVVVVISVCVLVVHFGRQKTRDYNAEAHFSLGSYCYADKGLLFFDSDCRLNFIDGNSGQMAFVCSNVSCEHKKAVYPGEIKCAAASIGLTNACLMSEDKIYVLGCFKDSDNELKAMDIYQENLDGTEIKKIKTIDGIGTVLNADLKNNIICVRFMNTLDLSDENNPIELDPHIGGFAIYNLETGDTLRVEMPVYEEENNNSVVISSIYFDDRHVLLGSQYSGKEGTVRSRLFEYDIQKEELLLLKEIDDGAILAVNEKGCIYHLNNGSLVFLDYEGNEKEIENYQAVEAIAMNDEFYYTLWDKGVFSWYKYAKNEGRKYIGKTTAHYNMYNDDEIWLSEYKCKDDGEIVGTVIYKLSKENLDAGRFDEMKEVYNDETKE